MSVRAIGRLSEPAQFDNIILKTNSDGTLGATVSGISPRNGSSAVCERALTVANNVAIDIDVCGVDPSSAAVKIADQIAAKVRTA